MDMATSIQERKDILSVSPQFKKEVIRSVMMIVVFIAVYFILFALSLGLVALSFWGGITIVFVRPGFLTLVMGIGLVACGIMVFVFLVKFLFARSKTDNSDSIEITAGDHPVLFETIYALAQETGTPRPRRIFLSADVNACVFYNSSFWSMFLPVRKNLKIGLGLVNAVNVSELKAVIAHEFGHFSQRSMKVGSWVYLVNKIIYDMLHNNKGYAESLGAIGSIHGIVAIFVHLTIQVVRGIQWILQQVFKLVNKSYLGLSRQMEFHADLVASSVCGSNNVINALKRIEFAQVCFSASITLCNKAWEDKKVMTDFYSGHRATVQYFAHINKLSLTEGLPVITDRDGSVSNRINCKDQWASHPTLPERTEYLAPFLLTSDVDTAPAWMLFNQEKEWKNRLTKLLYASIPENEVEGMLDVQGFEALLQKLFSETSFPSLFKEFYNGRQVSVFDAEVVSKEPFVMVPLENLLTEDAVELPKKIKRLQEDVDMLNAILRKEIHTGSFDFDGQKYDKKQAAIVKEELEKELEQLRMELDTLDRLLFRYFYGIAPLPEAEALKEDVNRYHKKRLEAGAYLEKVNKMMNSLGPLYRGSTLTLETITSLVQNLKKTHEPLFKDELQHWLLFGIFDAEPKLKEQVKKFIASDYQYFSGNSLFENELFELDHLVQEGWNCIGDTLSGKFKSITVSYAAIQEAKEKVRSGVV
jgi:Zn-dependent protease with chaperone function